MPDDPANPTGKTYHHGDLRRRLLEATRTLVEDEGPDAVTLARIARMCGVSVAAPYRHFAGKKALLGAVAGQGFVELRDALAAAGASTADAHEGLISSGVAYVEYALDHPHLFRLMFSAELRDRQSALGPSALAQLRALVEPLVPDRSVETGVRAAWAIAHGLALLRLGGMLTFTEEDSTARLREELATVIDGIAADGRQDRTGDL